MEERLLQKSGKYRGEGEEKVRPDLYIKSSEIHQKNKKFDPNRHGEAELTRHGLRYTLLLEEFDVVNKCTSIGMLWN